MSGAPADLRGTSVVRVDAGAEADSVEQYDVVIGARGAALRAAREALAARAGRFAIVADERVLRMHGDVLGALAAEAAPRLELAGGEAIKDIATLGRVLDFCAGAGLDRSSALVALGGGTVGDLTGLAASLFKRGIDVVQVPTTLLAQVDASVGGKTAINLAAGKNLAGTFHQPRAVFCDTGFLGTLDRNEFASGLGEVLKTALLGGEGDLTRLEERANSVRVRDEDALVECVRRSVEIKAAVVASDPRENGPRRALNLGHTFAHAIEHAAGYGAVPHGIAVAVGLVLAARASAEVFGGDRGQEARVRALLERFDLPTDLAALRAAPGLAASLTRAALVEGLRHDKKGAVDAPEFILLRAPGDPVLGVPLAADHIDRLLA